MCRHQVELTSRGVGWQGLAFQDEVKVGTIPLQNVAKARHQPLASSQPLSPKMAVLLGPAYSASRGATTANEMRVSAVPNRASSSEYIDRILIMSHANRDLGQSGISKCKKSFAFFHTHTNIQ